jgi:hypothetical protein
VRSQSTAIVMTRRKGALPDRDCVRKKEETATVRTQGSKRAPSSQSSCSSWSDQTQTWPSFHSWTQKDTRRCQVHLSTNNRGRKGEGLQKEECGTLCVPLWQLADCTGRRYRWRKIESCREVEAIKEGENESIGSRQIRRGVVDMFVDRR